MNNSQSGNALWFVLLAIVLMGALTLTLSRGGSKSDQTGEFEQQRIKGTQILRTAASIEQAIRKLQLTGGCSENDVSFFVAGDADAYEHTPEVPECQVFSQSGAGLNWPGASWRFVTGAVQDIGTGGTELLALYTNATSDMCQSINRELGLSHPLTDSFTQAGYDGVFTGAFTTDMALGDGGGGGDLPAGKRSGCFQVDTTPAGLDGDYIFYHVLLVR